MKKLKHLLLPFLCLMITLNFTSCGKDDTDNSDEPEIPSSGGDSNEPDDPSSDGESEENAYPEWIAPTFAQALEERGYIENAYTVTKEEVATLTKVNVSGIDYQNKWYITSLKGLEYFVNLEEFDCGSNYITEIDVSNLTKLTHLRCVENDIEKLDVSNLKNLVSLYCYTNQITSLDLSNNSKITYLDCSNNRFSSLNVSNLVLLKSLTCSYLNLTELDVTNCTLLLRLLCHGNKLQNLNISTLKYLGSLDIRWNPGKDNIFTLFVAPEQEQMFNSTWEYNDQTVVVSYQTISN